MSVRRLKAFFRGRVPAAWRLGLFLWWRARLALPWLETAYFRQLRRLRRGAPPPTAGAGGKRVLFFATRQERDQVAMVTTLAWSLQRRGHSVAVLGCDRVLKRSCNTGNYPRLSHWVCRACHLYASHGHRLVGHDTEWLGQLLPPGARKRAQALVDALAPPDYPGMEYRGYAIGRLTRHSVAHFLRTDKITADPESLATYREWLVSAVWLVDACELLLDRRRPDAVVLLNGLFAPEWIMVEAAERRRVHVITWEVGFRPETFFFRHDRATDVADPAYWPQFANQPLTREESERLDRYLAERATGGGYLLNYFPNLESSAEAICAEFAIDRSRRLAVLFPNITWDSTLFERDIGFGGMADWIVETVGAFAERPEAQLVIRVHPAEVILPGAGRDSVVELLRQRFPTLPPNVIVVPPESGASSYVLMSLADCGLVYGSTTGIEMGVRGVPVILAGDVYYRGLGLSIEPATREEYRAALDAVLSGRIAKGDAARIEAWRRYAYYAIFRASISLHQVRYESVGNLPELRYASLSELDEGKDANLDAVCRGIVEGTPFLAARMHDDAALD